MYQNPFPFRDYQPIHNMSVQPQASCYFVKSSSDLSSINVMPSVYYVGLNSNDKEIYLKRMNNDGIVEVETYILKSEQKQKTETQAIADRLTNIENKISMLVEKKNESVNNANIE